MKAIKVILALLLILSFSSSATGAEIIERGADYNIYKINETDRRFVTGGDVENALPFDGGSSYVPWNLVFAEGTPVGNWTWLGKGTIGYLIKPSISTVRMYPIRGDQTKYIEIAPIAAQPSIVNQISPKSLELYIDKENTRWSLSMTPQGFKPTILLKPGYSGDGTFQFRFELNGGLTLEGAKIMNGTTQVLIMHNPFLVDANGIERAVSEDLSDGVVTLIANLTDLTYPILVDPTLGPINPNMDTRLSSYNATKGYGQSTVFQLRNSNFPRVDRGLLLFNLTGVSGIVTKCEVSAYYATDSLGSSQGKEITLARCTRTDWEDAGAQAGTEGAEANWTNYKDPNVAWTAPGGDFTLTDSVTDIIGADGTWNTFDIIAIGQDAIDNRGNLLSVLLKFTNESTAGDDVPVYTSSQWAVAELRPKVTVEYTEDITNHAIKPWCKGVNYENRPCLPFGSLFPN